MGRSGEAISTRLNGNGDMPRKMAHTTSARFVQWTPRPALWNYSLTVQLQWHSIAIAPGTFAAVANRRLQSTGIRQKERLRAGVITRHNPIQPEEHKEP